MSAGGTGISSTTRVRHTTVVYAALCLRGGVTFCGNPDATGIGGPHRHPSPRSLAQLRVFVGVLCTTQPRPPVHTVIIHGSGDFRGALARALTSSISWCQVGWLTLRMGSCCGLTEATVCRLLQHLQEEAVNLGEFILELPAVSMGDAIARQVGFF